MGDLANRVEYLEEKQRKTEMFMENLVYRLANEIPELTDDLFKMLNELNEGKIQ